jgi:hypothetical protein
MAMNRSALLPVVLLLLLTFGLQANEPEIEGRYSAIGTNPGGSGGYNGTVTVSRTNETYKVVWNVGTLYVGTGVLVNDVLSVAYTDERRKWFGIVAYRVLEDGRQLEGVWGPHGGKTLGSETLVRH